MSITETAEHLVPTGTWKADGAHSTIEFAVRHMGLVTIKGHFVEFEAALAGGEPPSLSGSIVTASVGTHAPDRDAHLRTPDFFDSERYPEARLLATRIERDRILAELTLKGVTRTVELAARFTGPDTDPWGNARIGLELDGEVDRTDFGVSWNAPLPGGGLLVADRVKLFASFSFVKEG